MRLVLNKNSAQDLLSIKLRGLVKRWKHGKETTVSIACHEMSRTVRIDKRRPILCSCFDLGSGRSSRTVTRSARFELFLAHRPGWSVSPGLNLSWYTVVLKHLYFARFASITWTRLPLHLAEIRRTRTSFTSSSFPWDFSFRCQQLFVRHPRKVWLTRWASSWMICEPFGTRYPSAN